MFRLILFLKDVFNFYFIFFLINISFNSFSSEIQETQENQKIQVYRLSKELAKNFHRYQAEEKFFCILACQKAVLDYYQRLANKNSLEDPFKIINLFFSEVDNIWVCIAESFLLLLELRMSFSSDQRFYKTILPNFWLSSHRHLYRKLCAVQVS